MRYSKDRHEAHHTLGQMVAYLTFQRLSLEQLAVIINIDSFPKHMLRRKLLSTKTLLD